MKILHTADWHWSEHKLDRCLRSADFIIDRVRAIRPDLHVIAGDYWDKRQVLSSASAVLPALDIMKTLASISPTVIILGNYAHDLPGSLGIFDNLYTPYPIYVTERAESILLYQSKHGKPDRFEYYPLNEDSEVSAQDADAILHLFPYPNKSQFLAKRNGLSIEETNQILCDEIRKIFLGFAAANDGLRCPKIFVGHCNVLEAKLSSGQTLIGQDIMISKHDLNLVGADYYALGHIHLNQEIEPHMWYSGSIYHHDFGETEAKYLNVVEIEKGRVEVAREEIPSRPLALHEVIFDSGKNTILDENTEVDWIDSDLRIRIHLGQEQSSLLSDEEITRKYPGAATYKIERIIIPEERIRSDGISHARTLRERLIEWGRAIEKSIPDEVLEMSGEMETCLHSIEQ